MNKYMEADYKDYHPAKHFCFRSVCLFVGRLHVHYSLKLVMLGAK